MNKRFAKRTSQGALVVCAGMLTLWLSGCSTDSVSNSGSVSSASPSPQASAKPTPAQSFSKPLVKAKEEAKTDTTRIVGLIQSTDPTERARQVQASINGKRDSNDPFSSLPPIVSTKTPAGLSGIPQRPSDKKPSPRPISPVPVASRRSRPTPNPTIAVKPSKLPDSLISALPPVPEPTLAKGVEVTGVIVVAGVPQAIVKAPNEASSRYVEAGQRLSNGQVLVKRIEMNSGSDPVVILEQNGVEVTRPVGDKGTPVGSPTAMQLTVPAAMMHRSLSFA